MINIFSPFLPVDFLTSPTVPSQIKCLAGPWVQSPAPCSPASHSYSASPHCCFTPFPFPFPFSFPRLPHSVACIISVSGTLGHIDILERCNGKLRISISRHKLPAPLCHAPLPLCTPLRLSLCCCLRSVSIRFDLVSFGFASLRFATVSTCVLLRLEKPFLSFPLLSFSIFIFHFARVNLQLSPATAAASASASASASAGAEPWQSVHFLCVAQCLNGWHAASAVASILRDAAKEGGGKEAVELPPLSLCGTLCRAAKVQSSKRTFSIFAIN